VSLQTRVNEAIQTHYTRADLGEVILATLEKAGKDVNRLTPEDLAPIDQFHICGRAAEMLSARTGLAHLVEFRQGDATELPFDDQTFDVVWTEHVAMNIPDKTRLYKEMHRVLKPGGTLAIYDVLAGSSGPVLFPVPWARTPDTSFLVQPNELRKLLKEAEFTVTDWSDTTEAARAWFVSLAEKIRKEGFPSLGFHVLLGADFKAMAQNQGRNLQDGRIVLAQIVARK
jgi:SAM-dependent methyltransferase